MKALEFIRQERRKRHSTERHFIFSPRPYQNKLIQAFDDGVKYFLVCWARRLGKDLFALSIACRECINNANTVVYYIFPTMKQGRMMILDGFTEGKKLILEEVINRNALRLPKNSDKLYHSDNSIRFKNGSIIYFVGSQDANTKVGGHLDLLVISEMATIRSRDILTYLIPSTIKVGGKILLVSTPRFGSVFNDMLDSSNDDWYRSVLKANDTDVVDGAGNPVYTTEQLNVASKLMSESKFKQEYYCDTDVANEEAIYASSLGKAKWIEEISLDRHRLYVSEDLGINDSTALTFIVNHTVIHHYANVDKPTMHYISYIKQFMNRHRVQEVSVILPHDAKNRHDAIDHLTSRREAYSKHFNSVKVLRAYDVHKTIEIAKHSIESGKVKFLKCENVLNMVKLMKKYEWRVDNSTGENLRTPIHGRGISASNTCDSFEYYCMYMFSEQYELNLKELEKVSYLDSNEEWTYL